MKKVMDVPTRSTLVFFHNETNQELIKTEESIPHGEWGQDGRQRPPDRIPPGTAAQMGSDSAGLGTGTEASVRYTIGYAGASVYIHWNNPYGGENSYHQHTDYAFHVLHSGGAGNNAIVHFFIRHSELRRAGNFRPSEDGFKFANSFGEAPYSLPPLRGSVLDNKYGNAKDGLCGGMVFATRDYYEAGFQIPQVTRAPAGEQEALFSYLVDRLFDSFSVDSITLLLKLMLPVYPDTDEGLHSSIGLAKGRAHVMINIEWPMIRADIDSGHPSPIVLQMVKSYLPFDLGKNHQVLVYAYEVHGHDVEMHVYDPNSQLDDNIRIRFSTRTAAEVVTLTHNVDVTDDDGTSRPIYSFARMNYAAKKPPVPHVQRRYHDTPRHLAMKTEDNRILSQVLVESGRKSFPVMGGECGHIDADFERFEVNECATCIAEPVGFANPQVTWNLNGRPVPPGIDQQVTFDAWCLDYSDSEADVALNPVTVTTTVDGVRLLVSNNPADGNYSFSAVARCIEPGAPAHTAVNGTIAAGFGGKRLSVRGMDDATVACLKKYFDGLRTEPDIEQQIEEFLRRVREGLPPEEIHCPEEWYFYEANDLSDTLTDASQEQILQARTTDLMLRTLVRTDPRRAHEIGTEVERELQLPENTILSRFVEG